MQELEITWKRSLRVWWLLFWRGTIGGTILGYIFGFIGGFIIRAFGGSGEEAFWAGTIYGGLAGGIWGMFVIRMALKKKYSDFKIVLVPVR